VVVPIDHAMFIEKIVNIDASPQFADWRAIKAEELVTGRVTSQADARIKVEFRLWDVFRGAQLAGQQYLSTPDDLRRMAHMISDVIYERLTGRKGNFGSGAPP
jgi:TolB protein